MPVTFPVQPCSVIIGGLLSLTSTVVIQRPLRGALHSQAQPEQPAQPAPKKACCTTLATVGSALLRSYAINSLLVVTGAAGYESAQVVGTLGFLAANGPQLVQAIVVDRLPYTAVLSRLAVALLDTVGLALALTFVKIQSRR